RGFEFFEPGGSTGQIHSDIVDIVRAVCQYDGAAVSVRIERDVGAVAACTAVVPNEAVLPKSGTDDPAEADLKKNVRIAQGTVSPVHRARKWRADLTHVDGEEFHQVIDRRKQSTVTLECVRRPVLDRDAACGVARSKARFQIVIERRARALHLQRFANTPN